MIRAGSAPVLGARPRAQMAADAAGGFSPLSIASLVGWYDFGDPASLFTDTGRTTPVVNDGDLIAGVTNKALILGSGHLSQATSGKRPAYKPAVRNGLSVARGAAGNGTTTASSLVGGGGPFNQPNTIFIVLTSTAAAPGTIFDGVSQRNLLRFGAGNLIEFYAGTVITDDIVTTPLAASVITASFNGASSELFLNGASILTGNVGAAPLSAMTCFGDGNGNGSISGDISEMLVVNASPSTAIRQQVETYAKNRWGTP